MFKILFYLLILVYFKILNNAKKLLISLNKSKLVINEFIFRIKQTNLY